MLFTLEVQCCKNSKFYTYSKLLRENNSHPYDANFALKSHTRLILLWNQRLCISFYLNLERITSKGKLIKSFRLFKYTVKRQNYEIKILIIKSNFISCIYPHQYLCNSLFMKQHFRAYDEIAEINSQRKALTYNTKKKYMIYMFS